MGSSLVVNNFPLRVFLPLQRHSDDYTKGLLTKGLFFWLVGFSTLTQV